MKRFSSILFNTLFLSPLLWIERPFFYKLVDARENLIQRIYFYDIYSHPFHKEKLM